MSIPARTKIAVLSLLTLLVLTKLFFEGPSLFPSRQMQLKNLQSLLKSSGYEFMSMDDSVWNPTMTLFKDPCIYYISPVSAEGGTEAFQRQSVQAGQHLSFVYDGEIYSSQQPRWTPIIYQNIYKLLRAAKLKVEFPAVYAVRLDNICQVEKTFAKATRFSFKFW